MTALETVTALYDAIGRQDQQAIFDLLHDDVEWKINCADPGPVPWFGHFRGKDGVGRFFQGLTAAEFTDFTPKAMAADGDLVMVWLHVGLTAPTGKTVDMSEVNIWEVCDGKIVKMEALEDTAAVKEAFS
jgi:ketosteroid isomerase-like protein